MLYIFFLSPLFESLFNVSFFILLIFKSAISDQFKLRPCVTLILHSFEFFEVKSKLGSISMLSTYRIIGCVLNTS